MQGRQPARGRVFGSIPPPPTPECGKNSTFLNSYKLSPKAKPGNTRCCGACIHNRRARTDLPRYSHSKAPALSIGRKVHFDRHPLLGISKANVARVLVRDWGQEACVRGVEWRRWVCIAGKAAAAGIFLCTLNLNHQCGIPPTVQRANSDTRNGSSNSSWTTTHSPVISSFQASAARPRFCALCGTARTGVFEKDDLQNERRVVSQRLRG